MDTSLINDIAIERQRQDKEHPELPAYLLSPHSDPAIEQIAGSLAHIQRENNLYEAQCQHSWYGIAYEEQKEVFSARTNTDLYKECIQAASVYIRLAEAVKSGKVAISQETV